MNLHISLCCIFIDAITSHPASKKSSGDFPVVRCTHVLSSSTSFPYGKIVTHFRWFVNGELLCSSNLNFLRKSPAKSLPVHPLPEIPDPLHRSVPPRKPHLYPLYPAALLLFLSQTDICDPHSLLDSVEFYILLCLYIHRHTIRNAMVVNVIPAAMLAAKRIV